jgi:hypothetical protein
MHAMPVVIPGIMKAGRCHATGQKKKKRKNRKKRDRKGGEQGHENTMAMTEEKAN